MAKGKRRSRENKLTRGQFWTMVILSSVLLAFVSLVTISSYMDKPFMPTWDELFSLTGHGDAGTCSGRGKCRRYSGAQ